MRRLLLLGETEVWAHWTAAPAALLLLVFEGPRQAALGLLALCLHEAGHLLTARGLGYRVRSLELWPFGAALTADVGAGGRGALLVALGGPLCGLAGAGMSLLFLRLLPGTEPVMEPFFRLNLVLSAVNLLPGEPLDGGRALAGLLAPLLGAGRARRLTALLGLLLGGGLLGLGVYGALLGLGSESLWLLALLLLFCGGRALRGPEGALQELMDRQQSLRAGRPVAVREAALSARQTAGEALRALRRGRYTLIRVIGPGDRLLGTVDEGTLLRGLSRRGEAVTLGELLFPFDR